MKIGLLFSLLILFSCSQEKKTKTTLSVSLAALGTEFPGGILLRLRDPVTNKILDYEMKASPYILDLPWGNWNMYVIGFSTAARDSVNLGCGQSPSMVLNTTVQKVEFTTNFANCNSNPNYTSLAAKAGVALGYVWDSATWDGVTQWGP